MVPDVLLVQLHSHTHTIHSEQTDTHKAQIGMKHKHCPIEDLFDTPFQVDDAYIDFEPVVHATNYIVQYKNNWQKSPFYNTSLRGPPLT